MKHEFPGAHLVSPYLHRPQHAITVDLVGCGGTGSVMLSYLARLHLALRAFTHPGLMVRVFDDDIVAPANLGRQLFAESDLYANKAMAAVTRVNRYFGLNWLAVPERYDAHFVRGVEYQAPAYANILITAVDTAASRLAIAHLIEERVYQHSCIYHERVDTFNWGGRTGMFSGAQNTHVTTAYLPLYWLDLGNGKTSGQAILGNWEVLPQPKLAYKSKATDEHCIKATPEQKAEPRDWVGRLPTVLDVYGDLREYESKELQGPSCSLAEALNHQDLFINPAIATLGGALLWKLLRQEVLTEHGGFVNLGSGQTAPLPVRRADTLYMPRFLTVEELTRVPAQGKRYNEGISHVPAQVGLLEPA